MRFRARSLLAIGIAIAAVVDCALVVPLDDLRSDSSTPDVVNDVPSNVEAGKDASDGSTISCDAGSYCACAGPHTLCYDFDDDAAPQGPFDGVPQTGDASLALDTTRFASAPRSSSFHFVTQDAAPQGAFLYLNGSKSATTLVMESKVFLAVRPSTSYFEVLELGLPNGSELDWVIDATHENVQVICHAPCVALTDSGPSVGINVTSVLPTNKWVDVKVTFTLGATLGIEVTYNGSTALQTTAPFMFPASQPTFYAGAVYAPIPTGPLDFWLDDITFDMQ